MRHLQRRQSARASNAALRSLIDGHKRRAHARQIAPRAAAMDPFAAPKRKRDYESGADVLGATLSRLEEEAGAAAAAAAARPFVASAAWAGARPGYVFGRGAQGQGYYVDRKSGAAGAPAAAMPPPEVRVRRWRARSCAARRSAPGVAARGSAPACGVARRRAALLQRGMRLRCALTPALAACAGAAAQARRRGARERRGAAGAGGARGRRPGGTP
jgi:hypothetical protein